MMDESQGLDIPIIRLRPLRERKVPKRAYDKILASIKAIGLLEPLVVYPEGDDYVILDGTQRYRACWNWAWKSSPAFWDSAGRPSPAIAWSTKCHPCRKAG